MKYFYCFVISLILYLPNLSSKDFDPNSLPKLLGTNNAGTEFYFTFLPSSELFNIAWYHTLYISSSVSTKVSVEVSRKAYSKTYFTKPNEILEINLQATIASCYRRNERNKPENTQIWKSCGVHVFADDPIICYGLTDNHSSETSDGFIALPVESLGKEYIISSYLDHGHDSFDYYTSYSGITAAYDSTFVRFTLGGNDSTKTIDGLSTGEYHDYLLHEGDVLLIASIGSGADLSGSIVNASKPVSVVSGNLCANVPSDCYSCNLLEEMEIPTYAWGKTYHVTPIFGRKKNSIIKIFAKEPMTRIYRDGIFLGIIRTAGGIEGVGHLHLRADEGEPRPIVISGDKPISVTQYNTGLQDDNVSSDPFQMALVAAELYQKEITFNTPGIRGGYGYPVNYINLCYESDEFGNLPDDIEIAFYNYKDSVFEWYKLKDTLGTNGTPFAADNDGKQFSSMTFKLPFDGVYKMRADKPYQAYLYGFSDYDSYGMPATVYLDSLNYSDVPTIDNFPMFDIFPNPASDKITIKTFIGSEYDSNILIYDLIGKVIYDETCHLSIGNNKLIDIRGFSNGIYYIQISSGKEIYVKPFFVVQ